MAGFSLYAARHALIPVVISNKRVHIFLFVSSAYLDLGRPLTSSRYHHQFRWRKNRSAPGLDEIHAIRTPGGSKHPPRNTAGTHSLSHSPVSPTTGEGRRAKWSQTGEIWSAISLQGSLLKILKLLHLWQQFLSSTPLPTGPTHLQVVISLSSAPPWIRVSTTEDCRIIELG